MRQEGPWLSSFGGSNGSIARRYYFHKYAYILLKNGQELKLLCKCRMPSFRIKKWPSSLI